MSNNEGFDPESLRLKPEDLAFPNLKPKQPKPRANKAAEFPHKFYKRPLIWAAALAKGQVSGTTYALADCLLYEAWRSGSNKIKLTNGMLAKWHVGHRGKRNGITQLRRLHLISARQIPHKSPVITVRFSA